MPPKDSILKLRIPGDLKREAEEIATTRGESLAVLVRESLRAYLDQIRKSKTAPNRTASPMNLEEVDPNEALEQITDHLAKLSTQITRLTGSPRAAAETLQRAQAQTTARRNLNSLDPAEKKALVADDDVAYAGRRNAGEKSADDFEI